MEVVPTSIPDVRVIIPRRHGDSRGFFSEVYNRESFARAGIDAQFVQDNHSLSEAAGVVRALHYQVAPFAQAKLVRVIRGAILDVAVDIRRDSPTFGRHVREILTRDNWKQMFIPVGFAHGFATLEPETEVVYKVSAPYSPGHERGILWNDPQLGIDWGVDAASARLSDRDRVHPVLSDAAALF